MPPALPTALACTLLAATSYAAVALMLAAPATTDVLMPALAAAQAAGRFADGTPLRTRYTGLAPLDGVLSGLVAYFFLLVDGADPAALRFSRWFVPQLAPWLVLMHWEAGRRTALVARIPTLVGLVMQRLTGGVVLPLYYAAFALTTPLAPTPPTPDTVARAHALLPALALGFGLPSLALFAAPARLAPASAQLLAALWQPFPLWLALLANGLRPFFAAVLPAPAGPAACARAAKQSIQRTFLACGALSALTHIWALADALTAKSPSAALITTFVPYTLWLSLGLAPRPDAPPLHQAARAFFQYDCACIALGAALFFAWSHAALARPGRDAGLAGWAARAGVLCVVGGPGAALAWAAYVREDQVFALVRGRGKEE
ncbi:hypothetical protein PsYK624_097800 [Phanerochaete sordida]|uniref:Uncharacterized protein n=1 Tax=Phanerochaete sordida TaxID=48140 RepID=A0A9P3GF07_9APHY|nr:hypothetical protein PsYK624_097800 [Phanerochaete sordida]